LHENSGQGKWQMNEVASAGGIIPEIRSRCTQFGQGFARVLNRALKTLQTIVTTDGKRLWGPAFLRAKTSR